MTKAEQGLLEKIMGNVRQMKIPPAIPPEASEHAQAAFVATQAAQWNADSSDDLDAAVREWQKAVQIAPWWAQAYLNLGTALQKAGRPIEQEQALKLYLLASPPPANGQNVRMEIYKLEYETKRSQGTLTDSGRDLNAGSK